MVAGERTLLCVAGVAALFFAALSWHQHAQSVKDSAAWALARQALIRLNDSTVAKFATQQDSLASLKALAKTLHGEVIAGATIVVPKHDTTIVHDTLATATVDSVRTARFRDSTFAGIVSGSVVAPKCCAPLELALTVERPAFTPTVGFIQLGTQVAAVVVWQGDSVRVEHAFALPQPPKPERLVPWAEGSYFLAAPPEVRAGVLLHIVGIELGPSLEQTLTLHTLPRLGITVRKEW